MHRYNPLARIASHVQSRRWIHRHEYVVELFLGTLLETLRSTLRPRSGRVVVLAVAEIVVVIGLMGVVGGNAVWKR